MQRFRAMLAGSLESPGGKKEKATSGESQGVSTRRRGLMMTERGAFPLEILF